jgi:peptidoglycan/xylan/chitin deacetylase (PgdA/CDA1 family)
MFERFGYEMTTFRFPGGAMSQRSGVIAPRREILEELGLRDFDWHVDSGDARPGQLDRSAAALTGNVLNNTRGREHLIVLMHDSGGRRTTLEALPAIIAGLREQGYSFDVMSNYPQG